MRVKKIYGEFGSLGAFISYSPRQYIGRIIDLHSIKDPTYRRETFSSRQDPLRVDHALKNGIYADNLSFRKSLSEGYFFIREDHPAFNIDVLGEVKYFSSERIYKAISKPLAKSVMLSIKQD